MSPRRPPAPGSGGIPDPSGAPRAPRARAAGPGVPAAQKAATKKTIASKTPAQRSAGQKSAAQKAAAQKSAAQRASAQRPVKRPTSPVTAAERAAAAKKKQAAAARAQRSPISHTPTKKRAPRVTASRSGGLRPTSTRPGSARPRAGSAGRGSRGRGFGFGTGRPVWVLGAVMAALALAILPYFQKWLVQRSEIESVRAEVSQAQEDVSDLQKQKERWKDDDYVRAQARSRLNYVMPGETGYAVSDPTPSPSVSPSSTGEADVPVGNRSWFTSVWLSAQTAGSQGEAQAATEVP
ncbi:septum formation initiator family protein [Kineosporia sp. NBRC 101731]|uniref:FtsB family cell division protein n=1 Tax=Kineosporia sp. NBRC 101731 TaxID=3032199 RepID=UPI00249FEDDF|nr:septum formation initiator family protein [Kineosporia sp. NBRC 101731]GLY28674.1 hypothetical protein Kisp02_20390 [Kineosporia sp. NBRC 101731]